VTALLLLMCVGAPPELPAPPAVAKAEPDAKLTAKFRRTDGWVGGDGAFSVPLSDKRAVWLFSDSWVGTVRDGKRKDVSMVNNTVGVQEGRGPDAKLTFFVQKADDGKPAAIFAPPDGKGWFWQFAGHHADGKLHVFLPRFEKSGAGGAFGFKAIDMWLGTVSNPDAEPTKWKTEYKKVPFADFGGERKRSFGSAVLTDGDHAYVYGYEERPTRFGPMRDLLVARVAKDKLADFDSWRFFADGEWKKDVRDATSQAGGLGAEFSVSYIPGLKRYALVYTERGLSDRIVANFAASPEGPWSKPVLLYTCPEMKKDKGVFTYAGKAHGHLAGEKELVISYATNAYELAPVINNADLYWPNFVRVVLK
jgi:hypothetical protein